VADNITNKCCNKTDFGVSVSRQYAGSLFEQFTLFILEGFYDPMARVRIDQRRPMAQTRQQNNDFLLLIF
jgi:hypothetical protein